MEKCRIEDCEFCSYKKISEVYFCENYCCEIDEDFECGYWDDENILDDLGHMHECEKDYGYDGEY